MTAGVWRPLVSVVIPVLDEERHIGRCLDSVSAQDYGGALEVIVADGGSRDATRTIVAARAARDPRIRLIDNPDRVQAAGLNRAVALSRGEVVARLDGHAAWPPTHVSRCVDLLLRTGAENVGGTMEAVGETAVGRAVARAWSSRFAAGGARYRYATEEADTDTVWPGCYRRSALARVGAFVPEFTPHEDYELNHRLRRSGGRVVFSPRLPARYWARASWRSLARQQHAYGRAKMRVERRVGGVLRPHHLAPPALAAAMVPLCASLLHRRSRRLGAAALGAYAVACLVAGLGASRGAPPGIRVRTALVFPVVHLAWGSGFWRGALERPSEPAPRPRIRSSRIAAE